MKSKEIDRIQNAIRMSRLRGWDILIGLVQNVDMVMIQKIKTEPTTAQIAGRGWEEGEADADTEV